MGSTEGRVRDFVSNRKWEAASPVVPVGYDETDDGWLTINPDEKQAIKDLFDRFTNQEYQPQNDPDEASYASYAGTKRAIDNKYGSELLNGHRVKTLLKNPVYIGKPEVPESWVVDLPYDNVVEDSSLQIIDKETFQKAKEIIDEKDEKHSTDEDVREPDDFVEEFGLLSVALASERVKIVHDCGEPMIYDGQYELNGNIKTHNYYCNKCDKSRKWPMEFEHRRMKMIKMILNDNYDFEEMLREFFSQFLS